MQTSKQASKTRKNEIVAVVLWSDEPKVFLWINIMLNLLIPINRLIKTKKV
ncbi:hypothetical protein [Segetibacter koreensis]|uniref:hypothetical protein n=1 Tax=Segetibacter koreensis TaxID=398037 RepID=UPI00036ED6B7|nr:hypothetical protein [Segetibacter koreensis]